MRSTFAGATVLAVLATLSACTDDATDPDDAPTSSDASPTAIECDYQDADPEITEIVEAERPDSTPQWEGTVATTIQTASSAFEMTLDADAAPCAVNAILTLAEQGFYDDTECHHLSTTEAFYIQCGDPTGTGSGSPGWQFADEITGDETYPAGTVAMASGGADINGSQFFIVYQDTDFSPDYTVIGTVDEAALTIIQSVAAGGIRAGFAGGAITPPAIPLTIQSFTIGAPEPEATDGDADLDADGEPDENPVP